MTAAAAARRTCALFVYIRDGVHRVAKQMRECVRACRQKRDFPKHARRTKCTICVDRINGSGVGARSIKLQPCNNSHLYKGAQIKCIHQIFTAPFKFEMQHISTRMVSNKLQRGAKHTQICIDSTARTIAYKHELAAKLNRFK
jgi:hypothetical protein